MTKTIDPELKIIARINHSPALQAQENMLKRVSDKEIKFQHQNQTQ